MPQLAGPVLWPVLRCGHGVRGNCSKGTCLMRHGLSMLSRVACSPIQEVLCQHAENVLPGPHVSTDLATSFEFSSSRKAAQTRTVREGKHRHLTDSQQPTAHKRGLGRPVPVTARPLSQAQPLALEAKQHNEAPPASPRPRNRARWHTSLTAPRTWRRNSTRHAGPSPHPCGVSLPRERERETASVCLRQQATLSQATASQCYCCLGQAVAPQAHAAQVWQAHQCRHQVRQALIRECVVHQV